MNEFDIWSLMQQPQKANMPSPMLAAYNPQDVATMVGSAQKSLPVKSVQISQSMGGNGVGQYETQLDDAFKSAMDNRGKTVEALRAKLAEQEQMAPTGLQALNLRPFLAFADNLTGTKNSYNYQAPTAIQDHKATLEKLQDRINREENGLSDDQLGYLKMRAGEEAADKRLKMTLGAQERAASKTSMNNEFRLREKWENNPVTKASQSMDDHYRRIAGVETKTPAGQMSMVFAYMKMLDDGSVVRESEYATAARTAGLYDRAATYMEKLKNGTILSPQQIEEFKQSAEQIMNEVRKKQSDFDTEYKGLAEAYGMNPERVAYGVGFKGSKNQTFIVSNGKESLEVSKEDLADALKEGYQVVK